MHFVGVQALACSAKKMQSTKLSMQNERKATPALVPVHF
jgi:hypothetical protein